MSAKNKRDQLLSQLTNSLVVQSPPEPTEVQPSLDEVVQGDETEELPQSSDELGKAQKSIIKPTQKKAGKKNAVVQQASSLSGSASAAGSGKQAAFWLDDEDRAILHEMGMQLYSQGIKPSHNLVVRVALRMLSKDHRFFEKAKELLERDGRKIRHK